jgi:hypothetical protein
LVFHFSLGEGCTHIAGLLFALENITETQEKNEVDTAGCGSNKSNITALVVPSLEHILSLKLHDAELGFSFISVFRLHFKISFSLSLSYLIRLNFISSTVCSTRKALMYKLLCRPHSFLGFQ